MVKGTVDKENLMSQDRTLAPLESTVFVPLEGRIFATNLFPDVLTDKKVMSLQGSVPTHLIRKNRHNEYTLLACAVRAAKLDLETQTFLKRHPDGVIVELGAGLDTGFWRAEDAGLNARATWVEVDSAKVLAIRREWLGDEARDISIAGDARHDHWIRALRKRFPTSPVLVLAGGLSYFFTPDEMRELCGMLKDYGVKTLVFDAVNRVGHQFIGHYMKKVGHGDVPVTFCLDSTAEKTRCAIGAAKIIETPFYRGVCRRGMKWTTKLTMALSDALGCVKMVRIDF